MFNRQEIREKNIGESATFNDQRNIFREKNFLLIRNKSAIIKTLSSIFT